MFSYETVVDIQGMLNGVIHSKKTFQKIVDRFPKNVTLVYSETEEVWFLRIAYMTRNGKLSEFEFWPGKGIKAI